MYSTTSMRGRVWRHLADYYRWTSTRCASGTACTTEAKRTKTSTPWFQNVRPHCILFAAGPTCMETGPGAFCRYFSDPLRCWLTGQEAIMRERAGQWSVRASLSCFGADDTSTWVYKDQHTVSSGTLRCIYAASSATRFHQGERAVRSKTSQASGWGTSQSV